MFKLDHTTVPLEQNKILWHINVPEKYCWSVVLKAASTSITFSIARDLGIVDPTNNSNEWLPYASREPDTQVFRFAFVRNPYSRLVSYWSMRNPTIRNLLWGGETFEDFIYSQLAKAEPKDFHVSTQLRTLEPRPDFIGKIETFDKDWQYVMSQTGLGPINFKINSFKKVYEDYKKWYKPETKKLVQKVYREELEILGYSYD